MTRCIRCIVSGWVQGVFYRAATQRRARELGVEGWARNLPDGSVEVMARGTDAALDALREFLQVGPPRARVSAVRCEETDDPGTLGPFEVRR